MGGLMVVRDLDRKPDNRPERIELSLTASGLMVVRDLNRKPDLLEEWKPEPRSWMVRRECRSE